MKGDLDDLDILPPSPVQISIGGRLLEIGALRMRQWRPMTDALAGSWEGLLSGDPMQILGQEEKVYSAIIVATENAVDDVWLKSLYPTQVLRLFRVIVEINRDFFGQRVVPEMRLLMATFVPVAAPAASPGSSPGSPSGDTATTTS